MFPGVLCPVTITVTNLTDSWLTAKFKFNEFPDDKDLIIELPRQPLLLSPGKSEQFTLHMTSNVEMNTTLPFIMIMKDSSIEGDAQQKGSMPVEFKMPMIQAMSSDGVNKVSFPSIAMTSSYTKYIIILSDCSADLQLELSVVGGESMFVIKNVLEVKKSEVNKVLMERQGSTEEPQGKAKGKASNKQLCRLTSGNAIRVTITFNPPQLCDSICKFLYFLVSIL